MKKNLSVVYLFLKSIFKKAVILIASMLILQTGLFLVKIKSPVLSFEDLVEDIFAEKIFLAFGLLIAVAGIFEFYSIAKSYKSRLLSLKAKNIFLCEGAAGVMIFSLWLLSETILMTALDFAYVSVEKEEFITNMSLFLSFYRSDFLHFLLPLEDISLYLKNILIILVMGFSLASVPRADLRVSFLNFVGPVLIFIGAVGRMGEALNIIAIPVLLILLMILIGEGIRKEVYYEVPRED